MMEILKNWDAQTLLSIQEHLRFEPLDPLVRFITALGNGGLLWIMLGIILLIYKKTRVQSLYLLPTLGIATAINNLAIKNIVMRVRPYEVIEGLTILIPMEASWSFPSGHACSSFAVATALFLAFPGRGAWAYIPAALIALSRLYVGVHYPTDIIVGALVGTVVAIICHRLYALILSRQSTAENIKTKPR